VLWKRKLAAVGRVHEIVNGLTGEVHLHTTAYNVSSYTAYNTGPMKRQNACLCYLHSVQAGSAAALSNI
jgi:hypothetical protein